MKLNKTLAFAALIAGSLVAGGLAVQAQDHSTNTPSAHARPTRQHGFNIDKLTQQLDLTDDQKPKVKAVFDDQAQKRRDLRTDTSLSAQDKRDKMKEIRKDATAKLKDILTPEQFAKYQKSAPGHRRPKPGASATNAPAAN